MPLSWKLKIAVGAQKHFSVRSLTLTRLVILDRAEVIRPIAVEVAIGYLVILLLRV